MRLLSSSMKVDVFQMIRTRCCAYMLGTTTLFFVLSVSHTHAAANLQGYVMQVQMSPAICALDRSSAKQRKCLEGYSLTIAGLMPETTTSNCTTQSSPVLSPLQAKVVVRVMPEDAARFQLWRNIGGCVPMNASQYFRTIINLAEKLKIPSELTVYEDRNIQQNYLKAQFLKLNPGMPNNAIHFSCQNIKARPVLTEVKVCYKPNGEYKQCPSQVVSNCPATFDIKGSY